jgi:membrane-associated phospholipid phosphatase
LSRTAAGPVLRELRTRFGAGRAALGPASWRAWERLVVVGLLGMVALMIALVAVGQRLLAHGALGWESDFLLWLGSSGPFSFANAVFFQTFATDITLVILIVATAGIAAWTRRPITCLSIISTMVVPDVIGRFGWAAWSRVRPELLYDGIASPGFHAFPSGHTIKAMAVYGFLALLWIRASHSLPERAAALVILLFIITAVPVGRMSMGVHWPSDVFAGWILGIAWIAVLAFGLRYEHPKP